jgi:hypothetical protein
LTEIIFVNTRYYSIWTALLCHLFSKRPRIMIEQNFASCFVWTQKCVLLHWRKNNNSSCFNTMGPGRHFKESSWRE